MANRRQLVIRRASVRNIRKITRTMQLIATARFRQAMSRAIATKPYAQKLADMVGFASRSVAGKVDHPLLRTNNVKHSALIVITSNRGLCGGYNGSILRAAVADLRKIRDADGTVALHAIGKKGINYLRFLGEEMASQITTIGDRPRFEDVVALADQMIDAFGRGDVASVKVCYTQFVSAGVQRPTVMQLLPISAGDADDADGQPEAADGEGAMYDFSPEPATLLGELLPAAVRMRLFQCFTEAAASEQVARMVAMKAATDSAEDMIKTLTQQYNRARQTAITMELLDIIGGVAAIS